MSKCRKILKWLSKQGFIGRLNQSVRQREYEHETSVKPAEPWFQQKVTLPINIKTRVFTDLSQNRILYSSFLIPKIRNPRTPRSMSNQSDLVRDRSYISQWSHWSCFVNPCLKYQNTPSKPGLMFFILLVHFIQILKFLYRYFLSTSNPIEWKDQLSCFIFSPTRAGHVIMDYQKYGL